MWWSVVCVVFASLNMSVLRCFDLVTTATNCELANIVIASGKLKNHIGEDELEKREVVTLEAMEL